MSKAKPKNRDRAPASTPEDPSQEQLAQPSAAGAPGGAPDPAHLEQLALAVQQSLAAARLASAALAAADPTCPRVLVLAVPWRDPVVEGHAERQCDRGAKVQAQTEGPQFRALLGLFEGLGLRVARSSEPWHRQGGTNADVVRFLLQAVIDEAADNAAAAETLAEAKLDETQA